ncbi:MAG: hypothetical protein QM627_04135 [Luteolibacter sp.]
MNTNPDEAKLALWLEDELHGEEHAAVEQWAAQQPEHLAAREEIRRWKQLLAGTVPASEEPPFPDFFNSRLMQAIRETPAPVAMETGERKESFWLSFRSWFLPASAFAGMALAFWVGMKTQSPVSSSAVATEAKTEWHPIVYTPDNLVNAVWKNHDEASVIVLQGVRPIPDEMDFPETVDAGLPRDIDATAEKDILPHSY